MAGTISTGAGDDTIELVGGTVTGDILSGDGDDLIVWSSASSTVGTGGINNGTIRSGSGSDIIVINDPTIDLSAMTLDGGDDVSVADGDVDVLALLNGWSGTLNGSRTLNFEVIYIDGGTIAFDDAAIVVSSDHGFDAVLTAAAGFPVPYGILVDNGGTLDATNSLTVTGNVTLRDSTLRVGNAGFSNATITGYLHNPAGSIVDLSSNGAAAGDRLRIGGNYVGGGEFRLDAALDASNASDTVIIDGVVMSGVTAIQVTDVGDGTGVATGFGPGLGIRLVDVSATGGTTAGQFVLAGGPITVNAFRYDLHLHSDGVWYLQSEMRPIVPGVAHVPHVIEDIALTFIGTLHERVGEQEHLAGSRAQQGVWARMIGQRSKESVATDILGPISASTRLLGFQGGFDVNRWVLSDGSSTHAGLSFAYADASARSLSNGVGGETAFKGGLAGMHLTHYGRGGWYADAGLYGSWIDVEAVTSGVDAVSTRSRSWMASLEVGQALPLDMGGLVLEQQGQLIYSARHLDKFTDGATTWRFSLEDSLVGRIGMRLKSTLALDDNGSSRMTAYAKANLWGVIAAGADRLAIGTLPVQLKGRKVWADAGLGFSAKVDSSLSFFADGDVEFNLDRREHLALTGKIGVRFNW